MKKSTKIIYAILIVFIGSLFVSNVSEADFQRKIDNSRDPFDEFYMERVAKTGKPIIEGNGRYYTPIYILNYTNLGLFSTAKLESGWSGTLRRDGKYLGKRSGYEQTKRYIIIFGKAFTISEKKEKEN